MAEIRNPNLQTPGPGGSGSGGDLRTTMTFTILALIVVLASQYYFKPKSTPPVAAPITAQTAATQPPISAQPPPQSAIGPLASVAPTAVAAAAETETTIENQYYKIVFTNRGAQVKHWFLKKFTDSLGKPLDMVQPQAAARYGLPLSLYTYEPTLDDQLNHKALYQVNADGAQPTNGQAVLRATNALTYHYADGNLDVLKTIRFDSSYVLTVEVAVKRNGAPVRALVEWPAGLGDMDEFVPPTSGQSSSSQVPTSASALFVWSLNDQQDSTKAKSVIGNATLTQPYQFAAVTDLYFAAAFLPDAPSRTTVVTLHNPMDLPPVGDDSTTRKPADVIGLAVGDQSGFTRLRLFAGPKQLELLKSIHANSEDGKQTGPTLESLTQYGWFTVVAKPLYLALRYLSERLGSGAYSWGWAIILFTVAFNLIMLPLRMMAMKSSLKMMRIQPKIDEIKRKYANLKVTDPKKAEMNTEMMALYQKENVNLYGGCLPMLPQLPLFIAFFRVLSNAVDLRHAHWYWLTDLSVADPLHILPIIIIISMFATQMMTPTPGMDPAQRKMMAFMMPVIMGSMLWHYASGLALYWCTGNLINLLMQLGINQSSIGKEMHAIAAKRAARKEKASGNPKTINGRR